MDVDTVKRFATGRWPEILSRLGGCDREILDGRHHPCPKCQGTDRFRLLDEDAGALICNQCFKDKNGDGIAALMWLTGWGFQEAGTQLEQYLGITSTSNVPRPRLFDLVAEIASRKRMPLESFKKFGAHLAIRGKLNVARVPMYDEFGKQCSEFDFATLDEKWLKGMAAAEKPNGLFLASTEPIAGQTVLVTEGVKDAAALDGQGFMAIGLPTCEMEVRFARWFDGADVIIVPDLDQAGETGAKRTAARLVGKARSVKIARLPGEMKETGGDGVREVLKLKNGAELLKQAIADAKEWTIASGEKPKARTLLECTDYYLDALSKGETVLYSTGLLKLDAALGGGVAMGETIVMAARPSHGKSMLAMQWVDLAAASGLSSFIDSEEMTALALGKRVIQRATPIREEDWADDIERVRGHVKRHFKGKSPIYLAESLQTTDAVVREIDAHAQDKGIKIAVVDYSQRLSCGSKNRYETVSETVTRLAGCATRNNIIMLILCQLNREIEKRPDPTPKMSDLRESGQIEQDADVILFLQWPVKINPNHQPRDEYRIYIGKNRNRGIKESIVVTHFNAERQLVSSSPSYSEAEFAKAAMSFGGTEWDGSGEYMGSGTDGF